MFCLKISAVSGRDQVASILRYQAWGSGASRLPKIRFCNAALIEAVTDPPPQVLLLWLKNAAYQYCSSQVAHVVSYFVGATAAAVHSLQAERRVSVSALSLNVTAAVQSGRSSFFVGF